MRCDDYYSVMTVRSCFPRQHHRVAIADVNQRLCKSHYHHQLSSHLAKRKQLEIHLIPPPPSPPLSPTYMGQYSSSTAAVVPILMEIKHS